MTFLSGVFHVFPFTISLEISPGMPVKIPTRNHFGILSGIFHGILTGISLKIPFGVCLRILFWIVPRIFSFCPAEILPVISSVLIFVCIYFSFANSTLGISPRFSLSIFFRSHSGILFILPKIQDSCKNFSFDFPWDSCFKYSSRDSSGNIKRTLSESFFFKITPKFIRKCFRSFS